MHNVTKKLKRSQYSFFQNFKTYIFFKNTDRWEDNLRSLPPQFDPRSVYFKYKVL